MGSRHRDIFLANCLLESIEDENYQNAKKLLLQYEADPNLIIPSRGIGAIHYAAGMENLAFGDAIMMLMLKNGGDPNVRTEDGETPLHIAAIWNRELIIEMLLDHGGDLTLKDSEDNTPINNAIIEGNYALISIFQNYVFEGKIERKRQKQREAAETTSSPLISSVTDAMRRLKIPKCSDPDILTPNKTNYNFNEASPFLVNITHRKPKPSAKLKTLRRTISVDPTILTDEVSAPPPEKEEIVTDDIDSDDDVIIIEENLFRLTEANLEEHLRSAPRRNRISLVNTWRNKVNRSRKRESIVPASQSDLDSLISHFTCQAGDRSSSTPASVATVIARPDISTQQKVAAPVNGESEIHDSYLTADDAGFPVRAMLQPNATYTVDSPLTRTTIIQTEEVYVHTDTESNVVFYEQKFFAAPQNQRRDAQRNHSEDETISQSTSATDITLPLDYDTDALRAELTQFGIAPGPITKSTKRLYLKRLIEYKRKPPQKPHPNGATNKLCRFSVEMQRTLRDANARDLRESISELVHLEEKMVEAFRLCPTKRFREGNLKTSFIYLLIDPLISENLPGESALISRHEAWKRFVASIFYVGKGKSSRPYAHLYDAIKIYQDKRINIDLTAKDRDSLKLDRILGIWRSEKGVVCLSVFHNIVPVEAYTREAAIIDCIGVGNLTNIKRGDYYGVAKSWTMRQRKQLGVLLLYKAMHIFLAEGESQLRPDDIQQGKPK